MKHKKNSKEEDRKLKNEEIDEMKQKDENSESEETAESCGNTESCGQAGDNSGPGQADGEQAKEIENLKKQSEDYFNRLARLQADFENYKKRVAKEREDMYYVALETVFTQILPVVDNLERAVSAFKNDELDSKYIEGVEMVYKQLFGVLEKNGLKEIEAEGKDFDPNIHHAVMQEEDPENENKIKEVYQKGYILGSKVIRPSLVKVST